MGHLTARVSWTRPGRVVKPCGLKSDPFLPGLTSFPLYNPDRRPTTAPGRWWQPTVRRTSERRPGGM